MMPEYTLKSKISIAPRQATKAIKKVKCPAINLAAQTVVARQMLTTGRALNISRR